MHRLDPTQLKAIKRIPKVSGLVSIFAGCCVIVVWIFNVHILKTLIPYQVEVRPNTALSFLLLGLALLFVNDADRKPANHSLTIKRILAVAAMAIGIETLFEYTTNIELGIDEWVGKAPIDSNSITHWGRISIPTAICVCLLSVGLLLVHTESKRLILWTQGLVLLIVGTSFFAYLYNIPLLASYSTRAIPISGIAALVFGILAVAVIFQSGLVLSIKLENITRPVFFVAVLVLIALALAFAQNGILTTDNSRSVLQSTKIMDDLDSIHDQLVTA